MNTKVILDIQNLLESLNGNYIVVRLCDFKVWFYGCFKSKEKAQKAVDEHWNAFMVEVVRE